MSAANCGVNKACSKFPGFEKKFFRVDSSFPASSSSECSSNADSRKPSSISDVAMSSQSLSDILGRGEVLGVDVAAIIVATIDMIVVLHFPSLVTHRLPSAGYVRSSVDLELGSVEID